MIIAARNKKTILKHHETLNRMRVPFEHTDLCVVVQIPHHNRLVITSTKQEVPIDFKTRHRVCMHPCERCFFLACFEQKYVNVYRVSTNDDLFLVFLVALEVSDRVYLVSE